MTTFTIIIIIIISDSDSDSVSVVVHHGSPNQLIFCYDHIILFALFHFLSQKDSPFATCSAPSRLQRKFKFRFRETRANPIQVRILRTSKTFQFLAIAISPSHHSPRMRQQDW